MDEDDRRKIEQMRGANFTKRAPIFDSIFDPTKLRGPVALGLYLEWTAFVGQAGIDARSAWLGYTLPKLDPALRKQLEPITNKYEEEFDAFFAEVLKQPSKPSRGGASAIFSSAPSAPRRPPADPTEIDDSEFHSPTPEESTEFHEGFSHALRTDLKFRANVLGGAVRSAMSRGDLDGALSLAETAFTGLNSEQIAHLRTLVPADVREVFAEGAPSPALKSDMARQREVMANSKTFKQVRAEREAARQAELDKGPLRRFTRWLTSRSD